MDNSLRYWLGKWTREGYAEMRAHGLAGVREGLLNPWRSGFVAANQAFVERVGNPGRPIYEPDWDVLIVLDACRVDLMAEVAGEYEFLPEAGIGTFRSRGSKSDEWLARNFTPDYADEMARTAYVTGNPFSRDLDGEDFALLDEVWRYAWDEDLGTIPARPLTDRAIDAWRERDGHGIDRLIVHYMQPHAPFVAAPEFGSYGGPEEFGEGLDSVWLAAGPDLGRDELWPPYRENLRYVLDDVGLLLENLDAESVVLSADHGNAVGEFGIWGHSPDVLLPCVRQVPWVETRSTDTGDYEPSLEPAERTDTDDDRVAERLRALGYAEDELEPR